MANSDKKISATNTTTYVYQALLKKLLDREILPGSKINQKLLANELNTSRTPIINALHKLEMQGLVENDPNKGFYVHKLNIRELLDIWILREALDTMIVIELSETINQERIQRLEDVFKEFTDGSTELSVEAYSKADQKFHSLMYEFSENELAKKVNEHFRVFNRSTIAGLIREPHETLPEHMKIIQSLKNNDKEAAREAVITHIDKTRKFFKEAVERLQKLGINPKNVTLDELANK